MMEIVSWGGRIRVRVRECRIWLMEREVGDLGFLHIKLGFSKLDFGLGGSADVEGERERET